MAKRKLGASFIILCIAAVTLISGTYAWFLVGGFASLFDIGFDVIESTGGLLLQGDAGTAEKGSTDWGTKLEREDFSSMSFIAEGGKYKPVSGSNFSQTDARFVDVDLKNNTFTSNGLAPSKSTAESAGQICYNDFTFRVKSDADAIPGDATSGAYVQIVLTGEKSTGEGETENTDTENGGTTISAANAARVAVTIDGVTTVYSVDAESYNAVTNTFSGEITDTNENRIIDTAEDTGNIAGLASPASYAALKDGDSAVKIYLGEIPSDTTNGKQVTVRIWMEGNDKDCVDFADRTVAGKSLMSRISFGIDE